MLCRAKPESMSIVGGSRAGPSHDDHDASFADFDDPAAACITDHVLVGW